MRPSAVPSVDQGSGNDDLIHGGVGLHGRLNLDRVNILTAVHDAVPGTPHKTQVSPRVDSCPAGRGRGAAQ
jgi:hypothetical protein